jgi:hypothetical protein
LAGRRDFLYVADCKLATMENMNYIAEHDGRFVSVLPRTRSEDAAFRQRVRAGEVVWQHLWNKTDQEGQLLDRFSVCAAPVTTPEGYHLWWFHSTRKAEFDLAARDRRLQRAEQELRQLQQKLRSPRSRHRDPGKVQDAIAEILKTCDATSLIQVRVEECPRDTYRQQRSGRPGKDTAYVKETSMRLDLHYTVDAEAFLCVYFFALLAEALLERELRRAMEREGMESLPLYPEGRDCRRPTARRLIDVFALLQRHILSRRGEDPVVLLTDLAPLHRKILRLLGLTTTIYR